MPQCWDGVNLKSEDNSHVSYSQDAPDNGPCPTTHPHHLPSLFYEFFYMTNNEQAEWGMTGDKGKFVLAQGDPTGYGMHGDFTNGWDQTLLSDMVDQCFGDEITNQNAGISDCAPLAKLQQNHDICKCTGQEVDEEVGFNGPLSALPGCNP